MSLDTADFCRDLLRKLTLIIDIGYVSNLTLHHTQTQTYTSVLKVFCISLSTLLLLNAKLKATRSNVYSL